MAVAQPPSLAHPPAPSSIPRRFREPAEEVFVGGNRVTLLRDGREAFPAMLRAIAEARRTVHIEMYWFGGDRIGRRFAEALAERVRAGVEVRVIYDAIGSADTPPTFFDAMRRAGVKVHEFHPVAPWRARFRLGTIFRRDHRKILVVDDAVGFTGGLNVGDPWAPVEDGGEGWRDTVICVEGPAARELSALFGETWKTHAEEDVHALGGRREPAETPESAADRAAAARCPVRVLGTQHRQKRRTIRHAYLYRMYYARRFLYVTNSYFVPEGGVRRGLIRAARRGVDVRILVPKKSDLWMVAMAGRANYDRLLRHGVRIFEWQGSILHAKTAVIDSGPGIWSTVGSFNMDRRSWRYNLEVNVAIEDATFGESMRAQFVDDLKNSIEIDLAAWRRRPWSERVLEKVCHQFRALF